MYSKADLVAAATSPRTRKWGVRIAIFLVIVGILGFFVVPPVAKNVALKQLGEILHREVSVGAISFNPYTLKVEIRDVSIKEKDGKELVGFDSLLVDAEFTSIMHRGIVIREIALIGPRVRLVRIDETHYNISDLIEEFMNKPKEEDSPPPRFSINNIQLANGRIEFVDMPEKLEHAITDINLRLPFVSNISYYTETYVEPHFSAKVNGAPLLLEGKSKPFDNSRESELVLDLDNFQIGKYLGYSPVELPIKLPSGALFGDLHFRFLETKGEPSTLSLDGKLAIKDFKLEESSGAHLASFRELAVDIKEFDLLKKSLTVAAVKLDAPEVDVAISRQGDLNWLKLVPPSDAAAPAKAPADEKSTPLAIAVDAVSISDGRVRIRDESTGFEQKGVVENIRVDAANYVSSGEKPIDFSFSWKIDAGDRLKVDETALEGGKLDLKGHKLNIGKYRVTGSKALATRMTDGSLQFFKAPILRVAKVAGKAAAKSEGPAWQVTVDRVELDNNVQRFEDKAVSPTANLALEVSSLVLENVSTQPDAVAKLAAKLRVNQKGAIDLSGTLKPLATEGEIAIDAREIELLPLQPYVADKLNVVVTRGQVAAKGTASFKPAKEGGIAGGYRGNLTVGNFYTIDKANSFDLLKWKSFYLGNMDIQTAPMSIGIGEVALSDFYARIILNKDGKLNLQQLVRQPEGEAAAADKAAPAADAAKASAPVAAADAQSNAAPNAQPAATEPAKPVLPIKVGKVSLQGGNVNFSDYFVKPNYTANIKKLTGRVSGLSSAEGSLADMELRGTYNDLAPITIKAKLNPLAAKSFLDLDAEVRGMEMTSFSTYAGKYAGYGIDKGQLSLFLKYKIEDKKLSAENRVFLDQLTFGDPVESAEATKLPVKLAVSLLQNRKGEIDINLPISGSLDDPQFSVGGVIVKVILNLFVKAVTSPVALLGSLFGGGDELAYVEFDYGYATITDGMRDRLKTLVKVLEERDSLKLEIAGRIDPERDREGLKRALMERRVKAEKQSDLTKKATETGSVDEIVIDEKEYPKYLERAYKAMKFPKPRNFVGMVKELPVEEMEKLMMANIQSGDDELRDLAERRAAAAREWVVTQGKVPSERVFTTQPHLMAKEGPQNDKAKESRVDFLLK